MKTKSVTTNERKGPDKLALSVEDAAQKLSVSASFLRLEITRGRLRPARFGRRVLIPDAEIQRYLKLHISPPAAQRPAREAEKENA